MNVKYDHPFNILEIFTIARWKQSNLVNHAKRICNAQPGTEFLFRIFQRSSASAVEETKQRRYCGRFWDKLSLFSLHSSNLHHVVCLWPTDNLATKEVYGEVPFYAPARWLTGTNRPTSSGRKFAVSLPVTAVQRPELETHSWSPGDKSDKAILMY